MNQLLKICFFSLGLSYCCLPAQAQRSPVVDTAIETNPDFALTRRPPAQFEGGSKKFLEFLKKNLKYPKKAAKNKLQGLVLVNVTVERDGSLTDIKVEMGVSPELDAEALRVMALSSPWIPENLGGRTVRSRVIVPVPFVISHF